MKEKWVWLALVISVPLMFMPFLFGVRTLITEQGIPLLTVLLMNEFGFVLCVVGVGMAVAHMRAMGVQIKLVFGCVLASIFAIAFVVRLSQLYPAL